MKFQPSLLVAILSSVSVGIAFPAKADTVQARCDVYPQGEDQASSSGLCTFSQRQGVVGIQLQNGKRYDLRPVGNQPGNYIDQNDQPAYRQSGLGDRGQIYQLATESVYVYWDPAPYDAPASSPSTSDSSRIGTLRANNPNTQINVRSEPTINSGSPHYGLPGDRIEILRCVPDSDTSGSDLNWCNVRFVRSQATGWIRSDFIIFPSDGF